MQPTTRHPFPARRAAVRFGALVLVLATVGYFGFQARSLLLGPQILLDRSPTIVQHERTVTISGHVRNITYLTINDRPIFTDRAGNFEETIVLENGYTVVTLEAGDRYGRTSDVTRSFVYQPATMIN